MLLQTERKTAIIEEATRIANGIINRTGVSPMPKAGRAKEEGKKDAKKVNVRTTHSLLPRISLVSLLLL